MQNQTKHFTTLDFDLACYLLAVDVRFIGLNPTDDPKRYLFSFEENEEL